MFIRKSNGSLHQINESLYQELENHFFICENDLAYLCEDEINKEIENNPLYPMILQAARDAGYHFKSGENKKNYQWIKQIIDKAMEQGQLKHNSIKNMVNDYLTSNNMINNQNNDTEDDSNQQEDNQNNDTEDNSNQQEDNNNQGTIEQQRQVQQFASKLNSAYIKLIKSSKQGNNILKVANEQNPDKNWYKLEEVPADILLNVAKNNSNFIKYMLSIRLNNGVDSLSLSKYDKEEIKNLFNKDLESKYELSRIVGWISKREGQDYNIFDFPITDYYVKKYNKTIAKKCIDILAKGIEKINNGKWNFGDDYLKQFIKDNDLSKEKKIENITKKLKKNFSNDFILYVLRHNDKSINSSNLESASAEDIAEILMEDKFVGSKIIKEVENIIKDAMFQSTLLPFIDYLMKVNYDKQLSSEDKAENYAIKITMFNKFSSSSVMQKVRDIIQNNNLPYRIDGLKPKISAFYSEISDTIFKNTETGDICRVRFQRGFPLLQVIAKKVQSGYQKGKNLGPVLKY